MISSTNRPYSLVLAVVVASLNGCGSNNSPAGIGATGGVTSTVAGALDSGGSGAAAATGSGGNSTNISSSSVSTGGLSGSGGTTSSAIQSSSIGNTGGLSSATGGAMSTTLGGAAIGGASSTHGTTATGGTVGGGSSAPPIHQVLGSVQKGPFIRGTTLTLQELDNSLSPTGRAFTFETNDDLGHFTLPVNVTSRYVEIIAAGYYFDELANQLSNSQLTLRTISDISNTSVVNANLLTSLAASRERNLVTGGQSFQSARVQAEQEVLSALSFNATGTSTFDQMDITHAGDTNGLLLAASVLLEKLAYVRSASSPVAELLQLMANVAADIAADGSFDDAATAAMLRCVVPPQVDKAAVRSNLQARFNSLGTTGVVPAFEQYLVAPVSCCAPESRRCSGNTAQLCNTTSEWITDAQCAGSAPNCKDGRCESPCSANSKRCMGEVAEVCDTNGLWQDGVNCAWGQLVQLDPKGSWVRRVSVDAANNVTALWEGCQTLVSSSYSIDESSLRTARYMLNSGWTSSSRVDRSDAVGVLDADIAVEPSGKATLVWSDRDPLADSSIPTSLWSRRYSLANGWEAEPTLIDTQLSDEYMSMWTDLALAGTTPIATWIGPTSSDVGLWAAIGNLNSGWSSPATLDRTEKLDARPRIAANTAGDAFAVWARKDRAQPNVLASKYSGSVGWSAPTAISKEPGYVSEVAIATDASGNAIALWPSVASANDLWANLYQSGTGWGEAQLISRDNTREAFNLSVVFDSDGNALAIWISYDGVVPQVWTARYVRGRGWGIALPFEKSDDWSSAPQIVMGSHGRATAVWSKSDTSFTISTIWINRFTPGSGWASPVQLMLDGRTQFASSPGLAIDAVGRLTLIWTEGNGCDQTTLWAQRFE